MTAAALRRLSTWSIGRRIGAIALVVAIPLNLVTLSVILRLTEAARETQRVGLQYSARAVTAAFDAETDKYLSLIMALSRSPALRDGDLTAFEVEARRQFADIEDAWVLVADTDGRQLLNTAVAPQTALPVRAPVAIEAQRRAFQQRSPLLSDLRVGPVRKQWVTTIEVPIYKDGAPFRALAVAMTMRPFARLLGAQQIPQGWVAGIIDGEGRYVARAPGDVSLVGVPASDGWRGSRQREGRFEFASREGDPLINFNALPKLGNWTVGVGVKKSELQATAFRATRWAMVLGGALSLLSLGLAALIARRITKPLAELHASAAEQRVPSAFLTALGPPEITALAGALSSAAQRRQDHERLQGTLLDVTSRLIEAHDRKVLSRIVCEIVGPALRADICLKYRYEPATGRLTLAYHSGLPADAAAKICELDASASAQAFVRPSHEPLVADADQIASDPACGLLRELGIRACCSQPLHDGDGQLQGWLIMASTVRPRFEPEEVAALATAANVLSQAIERFDAEIAVRQAHVTFRHLVEQSPFGVYAVDADFRLAQVSQGAQKVFANVRPLIGRDFDEVMRQLWPEPFASEAIGRFRHTLATGEPYHSESTVESRKDIDAVESYDWKIERIVMPDGRMGVVCHFYDLSERQRYETELKAAHARQDVLMRELAHRGRNLVAVVQAIASRSFTPQRSLDESRAVFNGRLQALANTFATFRETAAETSPLRDLVTTELKAFTERVAIDGPEIMLPARSAQTLALMVHELATNASKHGALSVPEGRVDIAWDAGFRDGGDRFSFVWRERNGPPPLQKPAGRGFGTLLLSQLVAAEFSCKPEVSYAPEGLTYRFDAELATVGAVQTEAPSAAEAVPS